MFVQRLENGVAIPQPITPAFPAIMNASCAAVTNIVKGAGVRREQQHGRPTGHESMARPLQGTQLIDIRALAQ